MIALERGLSQSDVNIFYSKANFRLAHVKRERGLFSFDLQWKFKLTLALEQMRSTRLQVV